MSKKTLTVKTIAGTFTRTTAADYKFCKVMESERAMSTYRKSLTDPTYKPSGVTGRWIKDHGYAVTWHSTEAAAQKAKFVWDKVELVGIFAVTAD